MLLIKGFDFETRGFQNATFGLSCLILLGLWLWSGCASSMGASRSPDAGLIVVETAGHSSDDLKAIAAALVREMRNDRIRVGFYPHHYAPVGVPAVPQVDTGTARASKRLGEAWSAYYDMRLEQAWQLVAGEMSTYPASRADGVRARLLAALIRFASQDPSQARRLMGEIPPHWPALRLNTAQYPPKFVALYSQVDRQVRKRKGGPLVLPAHRPLTALRQSTRDLAAARQWKQVWLLRVLPQEGQNRAELQQVSEAGRRFTQYRSVRFGPQARPEKIAGLLWEGRAAI